MAEFIVYLVAGFFLAMSLVAFLRPSAVVAIFGVTLVPAPMRNEIRAVYGGFGLSMAVLLVAGNHYQHLRAGILTAVAAALLGMALGRLVSWLIERRLGRAPALFLLLEILLAGCLLFAARG